MPNLPRYAALNPDGTQLLVMDREVDGDKERHNFWLIDLTTTKQPTHLGSWELDSNASARSAYYSASFISSGPQRGKIMFSSTSAERSRAWLVDNVEPGKVLWSSPDRPADKHAWTLAVSDGLLLTWGGNCEQSHDELVFLSSDYQAHEMVRPMPAAQQLAAATITGDRLVYTTGDGCWSGERSYTVASVPLTILEGENVTATELYSTTIDINQRQVNGWNLGTDLFAWVENGELHACRYDGSGDTVLEKGVKTIYQMKAALP